MDCSFNFPFLKQIYDSIYSLCIQAFDTTNQMIIALHCNKENDLILHNVDFSEKYDLCISEMQNTCAHISHMTDIVCQARISLVEITTVFSVDILNNSCNLVTSSIDEFMVTFDRMCDMLSDIYIVENDTNGFGDCIAEMNLLKSLVHDLLEERDRLSKEIVTIINEANGCSSADMSASHSLRSELYYSVAHIQNSAYTETDSEIGSQVLSQFDNAPTNAETTTFDDASLISSNVATSTSSKVKPIRVDSVSFSVLAPTTIKRDEYGSIDVYMYTKSQRRIIEKAIKSASQELTETEKSGFKASRGSEVKIILQSADVEISDAVDTKIWDGECSRFDFQFFVPQDYSKKQIAFTCYVLFNDIQITRLHFFINITRSAKSVPVKVTRIDNKKAFVSYSHKDEKRVLAKLVAIAEVAPRMVFWLDSQSLSSGDVWRKEIRRAIRNADVFLLFWSVFAKQSEEVKKEWIYALKKKGLRFIAPVPLDPPSECTPPKELDQLHFGDSSFSHSEEMDSLTFASSKQFRRIK